MEAVESARGYEPWRIEFLHMRELREDGYNEGREDGIAEGIEQGRAEAQARIAELEAELAKYKGKEN